MADWRVDLEESELRALGRPERDVLRPPTLSWKEGFGALVRDGRCPWCRGTIADVSLNVGDPGVTWDCEGGCNP